jgi:hypothetical protein
LQQRRVRRSLSRWFLNYPDCRALLDAQATIPISMNSVRATAARKKLPVPNPDATPGAGSVGMAEHIPSDFRHGTASFASAADLQFTRTD